MHSVSRRSRLQESVGSYRQGASTYMVEESTRYTWCARGTVAYNDDVCAVVLDEC